MELLDKLAILADAAKYDAACTSSGARRGFEPGNEIEDWLAAEREFEASSGGRLACIVG